MHYLCKRYTCTQYYLMEKVAPTATTPRVLLIYTGGTIGMIEDPATGALRAFNFTYLQDHIPELQRLGFEISSIQFDPPIDSAAITVDLWIRLARTIGENYIEFFA